MEKPVESSVCVRVCAYVVFFSFVFFLMREACFRYFFYFHFHNTLAVYCAYLSLSTKRQLQFYDTAVF